jgi:hypothetical protein
VAGEALFVGWGAVARGREKEALEVFSESVQYWGSLKENGQIDDLEVVLLYPHGGDLAGYALLKGDRAKLDELRSSDEFVRSTARASIVVDSLGVVNAVTGEALGQQMGIYQAAADDLA